MLEDAIKELTREVKELRLQLQNPEASQEVKSAPAAPPPPEPPQGVAAVATVPDMEAKPGPEIDADGRPWDSRIDASTKTKTNDGYWKARRGVDRTERARIVGELKGQTTGPAAPQEDAPPPPEAPASEPVPEDLPSLEEVRARAGQVARQLGARANLIQQHLARYGVSRLSDVPPERYPDFMHGMDVLEQGGEP